jgi:hypothetical protein
MDSNILIAEVLVKSFGIIFGAAYALDKRGRKKAPKSNLPPIGLVSRIIFGVALISLLVSILLYYSWNSIWGGSTKRHIVSKPIK